MSNEKSTATVEQVETVEQADEVTPEQMAEVEAELSKEKSATEEVVDKALASQPTLRKLAQIIADLEKPLPARHLKQLNQGGAKGSTYIPWPIVRKYLDFKAPGWESNVTVTVDTYGATVAYALTIPTSDFGKVTRSDVGFEEHVTKRGTPQEKVTGFGGATPKAVRQGLKRAAVMFGLGAYLYDR